MKDETKAARDWELDRLAEELRKSDSDPLSAKLYERYHITAEDLYVFRLIIEGVRENVEKKARREVAEKVMAVLSPYLPRS